MDTAAVSALLLACAPQVAPGTAQALIAVESSHNPNAIGVVNGALDRQPRNRAEALATAHRLQANGWNFSIGLAQINVRNLDSLGLSLEAAFDPCSNLAAMQTVLVACMDKADPEKESSQRAVRQALSCYYSGNVTTGFSHGYVRRVVSHARSPPGW